MTDNREFFEDDEPVENIRSAFRRGTKGRTASPPESEPFTLVRRSYDSTSNNSALVPPNLVGRNVETPVPQAS